MRAPVPAGARGARPASAGRVREDASVADETSAKGQIQVLGTLIRAQRASAGLSLRDLAQRAGVSNAYLSQIERGLHEPSISVLSSITHALDVPLGELLERSGLLGDEPGTARGAVVRDTEAAILGDPELSEPQRIALLSIYRSFVPARQVHRSD